MNNAYYPNALIARPGLELHDAANYGVSMTIRGNRTVGGIANGYAGASSYDVTGFQTASQNGSTTTTRQPDTRNVAPTNITPNGDATKQITASFNSIYQLDGITGPNGTSATFGHDSQTSTTDAHGIVTTYAYFDQWTAPVKYKTVSHPATGVAKTYFDGLGRTIKEERSGGVVETEYEPCGCSPIGKVKRVSRPVHRGADGVLDYVQL